MRPTDIVRAFIVFTCVSLASAPTQWKYYPVNSNQASGFQFYFEAPVDPKAQITITGKRGEESFSAKDTIETDCEHSDGHCFFKFDIRSLDTLQLSTMTMEMSGKRQVVDKPRAGQQYIF
jgi:hypothetical protein